MKDGLTPEEAERGRRLLAAIDDLCHAEPSTAVVLMTLSIVLANWVTAFANDKQHADAYADIFRGTLRKAWHRIRETA
jgi:hypothetical protein